MQGKKRMPITYPIKMIFYFIGIIPTEAYILKEFILERKFDDLAIVENWIIFYSLGVLIFTIWLLIGTIKILKHIDIETNA